jgi:carbonic anhydrase
MFRVSATRVLAFILLGLLVPCARAQEAIPSPEKALELLKEGNARFVADKLAARDTGDKKRKELAKGQQPFAIVLTCADSRVAPELIFDQGLGDLFVLRVAGNVADPAMLGSIEFAVANLKSPLIVVLGHEECGAVKAAISGDKLEGNLGKLIDMVQPGKDLPKDKKEALAAGIKNNASNQAAVLTAKSDVIKEFVTSGRVRIVTGVYSLESGKVGWLETPKGQKEK